jgi:hypothetical protein
MQNQLKNRVFDAFCIEIERMAISRKNKEKANEFTKSKQLSKILNSFRNYVLKKKVDARKAELISSKHI